jgi:hypothetical protein
VWRYIAKIDVYEKEIGKSQLQQRIFKQMYRRAVSSGVAARQLRLGFVVARSAKNRNVNHSTLQLQL